MLSEFLTNLKTHLLVGGTSVQTDIDVLTNNKPHIIVGCSGRIFDMIKRKHLNMNTIKLFILDEADEMLSQGFKEQIHTIFQYFNNNIQVAIFSATLPRDVLQLTDKFMKSPINITMKRENLSLEGIQCMIDVLQNERIAKSSLTNPALTIPACCCVSLTLFLSTPIKAPS